MSHYADIQVFLSVAKCESFSKAAIELEVSKSYVSRRIAELEARLDVQLILRTTRKISLTDEGRVFYFRCVDIFESLGEAEQAIIDLKDKPRGTLRITVAGLFGEQFIVPAAIEFMKQYDGLSVEVNFNNNLVDLITEGFDLAVRAAGTLKDSSLIARKVADRDLLTCASPAYLEKNGKPSDIEDLVNHNCLVGTLASWRFRNNDQDFDVRIRGTWRSNNGKALTYAARSGLGIVQLPSFYVKEDLLEKRLIPVLEKFRPKHTAVWAVYPHNRHLSLKVRLFIDYLVKHFEENPMRTI